MKGRRVLATAWTFPLAFAQSRKHSLIKPGDRLAYTAAHSVGHHCRGPNMSHQLPTIVARDDITNALEPSLQRVGRTNHS